MPSMRHTPSRTRGGPALKFSYALLATCAVLILCANSARASSVDFYNHDNNGNYSKGDDSSSDGKNKSDWDSQGDSGKNGNNNNKSGGTSSADFSNWSGKDSHSDGDSYDGGKNDKYKNVKGDKDGKGDGVPPPLCAAANPGNGGKWGGDGDDKGKGHSGWGDDGGDKDKWGHSYYKKICDKGGKGDPGDHKHGCDPGNPTPLPGTLPMFVAALALLILRNRTQRLS